MDLEFEDWCQRINWFLPSSVILEESLASLSLSPHLQKQNNSTLYGTGFREEHMK